MLQEESADEADGRRQRNQTQETPIPPAVEDVAGHDQQHVLPTQTMLHHPVEGEDQGEEEEELKGGERHLFFNR